LMPMSVAKEKLPCELVWVRLPAGRRADPSLWCPGRAAAAYPAGSHYMNGREG
jgi:hypothetical protein